MCNGLAFFARLNRRGAIRTGCRTSGRFAERRSTLRFPPSRRIAHDNQTTWSLYEAAAAVPQSIARCRQLALTRSARTRVSRRRSGNEQTCLNNGLAAQVGAKPKRENARVAAALWGGADSPSWRGPAQSGLLRPRGRVDQGARLAGAFLCKASPLNRSKNENLD